MADYELYVGIDWASQQHQVCVIDATGRRREQRRVAHSGAGLTEFVEHLTSLVTDPGRIAVAIEVPRGAMVDMLLERGCQVFALNPKQLDRFRDRHTVAGAKDDRRDAFVLADALRTDRAAFRRLTSEAADVIQLRELARIHAELVQDAGRLTNRLREQLWRFYPQALTLCPAADEPWLWTMLQAVPTPAAAQRVARSTLAAVLGRHRIRRLTADEVLAALRAPALGVAPGAAEAASEHVALLLPRLALVHEQRVRCERRLDALLAAVAAAEPHADEPEHRDVAILRSLPGVGRVVAATMLAEASRPLAARDYQTLRAHAGVAPVTRQSGKGRQILMRRSCNRRLRHAVFHWARNSIRLDPRCGAQYQRLRQRHGHARALRGVADRLLRVLVAMLTTRTLYQPPAAPMGA
jgi:transposase